MIVLNSLADLSYPDYIKAYFLGFSIHVSNTTDILLGTLCYKDDNFTLGTLPAAFSAICPVHGQYVIYYNERLQGVIYPVEYSNDIASVLCEIEVYGTSIFIILNLNQQQQQKKKRYGDFNNFFYRFLT